MTVTHALRAMRDIAPHRILPVLVLPEASVAVPVRQALLEGGLACAEVTLRTPDAVAAIAAMAEDPAFVVGAGTVISAGQVHQVADAGASFVVGPGLSAEVAKACGERSMPYFPGVVTATEICMALELGLSELKFFPAQTSGGVHALKALGAPFREVGFVPTGGINPSNAAGYLALKNVAAVGGSWLVDADSLDAGEWLRIADAARAALQIASQSVNSGAAS